MKIVKPKVIVVVGPTASGKSAAAISLAQKFNGEIISADSRQIFRGMDIGSGKVPKDNTEISKQNDEYISENIRHYLIDVATPEEDFNVSHFKTQATEAIEEILQKGKIPIICGGTGFWIDAVVKNVNLPEVPPNEQLRKELDQQSLEELFAKLEKLDPERAKTVDKQNKIRLIRALEIIEKLGSVPILQDTKYEIQDTKYEFLQIGIEVPREQLNAKIKKRLEMRFNEGMIKEVENLLKDGINPEWLEKIGLEYRWISRYLQSKVSLEEMQVKLYFDIIHYAKRQMTWFGKNKKIIWCKNQTEIELATTNFLQKK